VQLLNSHCLSTAGLLLAVNHGVNLMIHLDPQQLSAQLLACQNKRKQLEQQRLRLRPGASVALHPPAGNSWVGPTFNERALQPTGQSTGASDGMIRTNHPPTGDTLLLCPLLLQRLCLSSHCHSVPHGVPYVASHGASLRLTVALTASFTVLLQLPSLAL
jgi:hypothetical protein